jgi:hypothetical protein
MSYVPSPRFTPSSSAPFTGYRSFYGSGARKYYIYPDSNWDPKWGRKPFLGTVYGDDPFFATREAYTKGLCNVNITFGLIALTEMIDPDQPVSRRYKSQQ